MNLLFTNHCFTKQASKDDKRMLDINACVYNSTEALPEQDWNLLAKQQSIFLQINYLKAIERNLPQQTEQLYLIIYQYSIPVAIAVFQLYSLKGNNSFEIATDSGKNSFTENTIAHLFKNYLSCTHTKILILGNLLQSNTNVFFSINPLNDATYLTLALTALKAYVRFDVFIMKDINIKLNAYQMQPFYTQPTMVLPLSSEWLSFIDYKNSLLPKYKKRISNTFHKNEVIIKKELSLDEIEKNQQIIYQLYKEVYNKSVTKSGRIQLNYFCDLKQLLDHQFIVIGYFLNDEMVAFSSAFNTHKVFETSFVGFRYDLNKQYKLYQAMLYDYVEKAILLRCNKLALGRTGLTIKSSLGALPLYLSCSIHFENKLYSHLSKTILKKIKTENFEQRQPFKETMLTQ